MNPARRWLILAGIVILAALIAFPLRGVIHDAVVVPAAFLLWYLGLLYRSLSQAIWWVVIVFIAFLILGYSLLPDSAGSRKDRSKPTPPGGQVESLSRSIQRSEKGTYFKWLVANRLGKLAYQLLLLRSHGKPRSVFDPLTGEGWNPSAQLQQYLESGLRASFADFPNRRGTYFASPAKTPLDHDIEGAVEFLESQQDDSHF